MKNSRLRIVSVCRTLPTPDDPSAGVFVQNRLSALQEIADVHVLQPVPFTPLLRPLPRWAAQGSRKAAGLTIEPVPMPYVPGALKWLDGMWLARAVRPVLQRLHGERPIDLIDAHFGFPDGTGCVTVGRELSVPVFITVRGNEHEWIRTPRTGPRLASALRAADGCIAVSHALQQLLVEQGVAPAATRVIHNAIERKVFCPGDRVAARQQLQLDPDQPLVVSVGHLVSRKRHHVLIESFARVRQQLPGARLVIIGSRSFETAYPDQLLELARRLGVDSAVQFVGNVTQQQVAQWLRAADVFALLTAREGCCNAVLEALAVGAPVVSTPAGDNAFFLREGVNGSLVPIDDVDATTAALRSALQRRDWDRGAIAAQLLEQVGGWGDVAARVLNFMNERLAAVARA